MGSLQWMLQWRAGNPLAHCVLWKGLEGHYIHQSDKECSREKGLSITEKPRGGFISGPATVVKGHAVIKELDP